MQRGLILGVLILLLTASCGGQNGNSDRRTLTVIKDDNGTGIVTSIPAGIDCGDDCSETYNENTSITLTATADAGSAFIGWSGDCDTKGQVAMNADKTCTATFKKFVTATQKNIVLLIHGFSESPEHMNYYFDYLTAGLPSNSYQVEKVTGLDKTFNIYSLGGPDANTTRIETFIKEKIGKEVSQLGGGSVYFVGHSMGGLISRQFSVWHPEKVAGIFMMGTPNGGMNGLNTYPLSWASSNNMNCAGCWNEKNRAQTGVDHYLFVGTCTDPALNSVEGYPNDGVVGQWSVLKLNDYKENPEVMVETYTYNDGHDGSHPAGAACNSNLLADNAIAEIIANGITGQ